MVVPELVPYQWVYVDVPSCNLENGTEYAVVAYRAASDCVMWPSVWDGNFTVGVPGYPSTRSSSAGAWGLWLSGSAFPFEIWGEDSEPVPPLEPIKQTPASVGGEAYGADKTGLLLPWIALGLVLAVGGVYLLGRRAHAVK